MTSKSLIIFMFCAIFQAKVLEFCYASFLLLSLGSCVSLPAHQISFHMSASPAAAVANKLFRHRVPERELHAAEGGMRKL